MFNYFLFALDSNDALFSSILFGFSVFLFFNFLSVIILVRLTFCFLYLSLIYALLFYFLHFSLQHRPLQFIFFSCGCRPKYIQYCLFNHYKFLLLLLILLSLRLSLTSVSFFSTIILVPFSPLLSIPSMFFSPFLSYVLN